MKGDEGVVAMHLRLFWLRYLFVMAVSEDHKYSQSGEAHHLDLGGLGPGTAHNSEVSVSWNNRSNAYNFTLARPHLAEIHVKFLLLFFVDVFEDYFLLDLRFQPD